MGFEFNIASRMKSGSDNKGKSAPSLSIAIIGMTMAIAIMILSIIVVQGFKGEISSKIYNLDSHIKVRPFNNIGENLNSLKVDSSLIQFINSDNYDIKSISLIAEKSAVLKTNSDFKGVYLKGVDKAYDFESFDRMLVDGRLPNVSDSVINNEILISKKIANSLKLNVGDKVMTYFIDKNVKLRKLMICGIYQSDFEDFDNNYIIGDINIIQSVNHLEDSSGDYIGIKCNDIKDIEDYSFNLSQRLFESEEYGGKYIVSNTYMTNTSYFTWLNLLDMNVVVIIIIMLLVTMFTLISGMLLIVLERVNMVGILKSMGANNRSIRKIFIYATNKLIFKSMFYGNIVALGLALLQDKFHFIKLDAEAYYVSYVPVDINWVYILLLNIAIIVISYLSLLIPSHIVSTIKPTKSIKF